MRLLALASVFLTLALAGCGPSEDGAKCATDSDCVNQCIDAVCAKPRAEGEMCAHGGQCGAGMECASWNQVGRCSVRCTSGFDCDAGKGSCEQVVTVAGEDVQVCKPSTVIDIPTCSIACELACDDGSSACAYCKMACRCRCSQDQECADENRDKACSQGMCGC